MSLCWLVGLVTNNKTANEANLWNTNRSFQENAVSHLVAHNVLLTALVSMSTRRIM